jgi:hypothetical protein
MRSETSCAEWNLLTEQCPQAVDLSGTGMTIPQHIPRLCRYFAANLPQKYVFMCDSEEETALQ